MSALLPMTAQGAQTSRRGKVLVGPVDLVVEGTGVTVVIGPNGSGKTTLLRLLHGTARCTRGEIRWSCGTEAARQAQSFVFQSPVMMRRSVVDNIAYPLQVRGTKRRAARDDAAAWAERVGLGEMLERPANLLSGGEQQKLAIARALITQPELVFLDEPCAALDGRSMREIEEILREINASGTRLVLTTHDLGQARRLGQEVLFMLRGKIHENGPAKAFFDGPQTPEAAAFLKGDIVE